MTALICLRAWWIGVLTAIDRTLHPEEYRGAHHGESIDEDRARTERDDGGAWWM